MKERKRDLPDAQEEKLEFVEHLAYFCGLVNREDITTRFGMSPASATNILSRYNQMAPGNLSYDIRLKRYEIGQSFKPIYDVRKVIERIPVYTLPKLHKPVDNDTIERLAVISRAIQRTQSLTITYSSVSSGTSTRQIVPVAFADNWLRWHLRAYDRKRAQFVDFVFSRIQQVHPIEGDTIQDHEHPKNDKEWHAFIALKIKAHPYNLADAQSFAMGDDSHSVEIRAAMAGYFLRLWNVDCSPDASLRGKAYQYVLANMAEVAKVADLRLAPGYDGEMQS
ncbi:MAG: WYL domain-containing protein [Nitrospira sp.]|nr:WYL domain-containing protein [Nitrospira sp.]